MCPTTYDGYDPPTPAELRALLAWMSYTDERACAVLGVERRVFKRYFGGRHVTPFPVLYTLIVRNTALHDLNPRQWRAQMHHHLRLRENYLKQALNPSEDAAAFGYPPLDAEQARQMEHGLSGVRTLRELLKPPPPMPLEARPLRELL